VITSVPNQKLIKLDWVRDNYFILWLYCVLVSSPFLVCVFVFGDDHVTCYVGAYVNSGDHADA